MLTNFDSVCIVWVCRQTGAVNFNSEALVLRDVLAMRGLSEDIELPVWRANTGWDWAVKCHKRGITQKLLTTAFIFHRLYLRATDKGELYVRQTKPLGRDEGLSPHLGSLRTRSCLLPRTTTLAQLLLLAPFAPSHPCAPPSPSRMQILRDPQGLERRARHGRFETHRARLL